MANSDELTASVTTENITPNGYQKPATTPNHSHGPSFGRYIAGCAACARKYPDGPPPKKERKARPRSIRPAQSGVTMEQVLALLQQSAPAPEAPAGGVTLEQVQALLQANQQQTQASGTGLTMEQLMAFAGEMRKPDPEVVAERAAAKARVIEGKRQNNIAIAAQIAATLQRQSNCPHKMPRGENAISGQQHSDGMIHPICVICQKEFTAYRPQGEALQMGLA